MGVLESLSNQCPLCRATVAVEPTNPDGDMPCPHCHALLAFLRTSGGFRYHDATAVGPVRERILAIVSAKFDVTCDQLTGLTTFEDLGADSLDVAEVIMELEQAFDLNIDDEEANHLKSMNDVIDYILQRKRLDT